MTSKKLDHFTRAYVETALWSSTDNSDDSGGEPLDKNYSVSDISEETLDQMIADCADFQERYGELFEGESEQAGHDFWLSRNGHGAGFFDGDWPENGDKLQEAAESYGEFDLYVGDDGEIHGAPLKTRGRGRVATPRGVACEHTVRGNENSNDEWMVRYVHKISPRDTDVKGPVKIPNGAFSDSKNLAAALRKAGVLDTGARIRSFRSEGDKVVVFPSMPGLTTYWHSIILTHADSHHGSREMRASSEPVEDPEYVIQGYYADSGMSTRDEFGYDDEETALREAKKMLRSSLFEGDHVRVITRDGELVWDSRKEKRGGAREVNAFNNRELRWSHDGVATGKRGTYHLRKTRNGWVITLNGHTSLGEWFQPEIAKDFADRYDRQPQPREASETHQGPGGAREAQGRTVQARRTEGPRLESLDFFRGQGFNAAQAKELANAEQKSYERGWKVNWEDDPEGMDSIGDIDPHTIKEILFAALVDEDGNVLASLGSIVDPTRKYRRVVEAELALEALSNPSGKKRTREHTARDYIAVDRNDRRIAGPFKSQGEATQRVPPGGHVKFSSAKNRSAPPAPSSYPMFRENSRGWTTIFERGFDEAINLWNEGQTFENIKSNDKYNAKSPEGVLAFARGMYAGVEALSGFRDNAEKEARAWGLSTKRARALIATVDAKDRHHAKQPTRVRNAPRKKSPTKKRKKSR